MESKYKNKTSEKNKIQGITLVALVITVIILLILVGITISAITGTSLFSRAKEAGFKSKMAAYKEQSDMYVAWQITETMNTDTKWINSGQVLKDVVDQEIVSDIKKEDITIKSYIINKIL